MLACVFNLFVLFYFVLAAEDGSDYYGKIGVTKDATIKEIRKAYKKLALTMHPDKSSDPQAHEKFTEITRIYEVLKDDDLRKKYDKWGEKGLEDDFNPNRGRYESWSYYRDDFGLYDNDDQIEVLDRESLMEAMASDDLWFIKFYSERCSHCNELAPTWRELATQMAGVSKFGAISCRDYRQTCSQLGITGYPTPLLFSPGGRKIKINGQTVRKSEGKYSQSRDVDTMRDYVLKFAKIHITTLTAQTVETDRPSIYVLSDSDGDSPISEFPDQYILSNRLKNVFQLYFIKCPTYDPHNMCAMRQTDVGGVVFKPSGVNPSTESSKLVNFNALNVDDIIIHAFDQISLSQCEDLEHFLDITKDASIVILNTGNWAHGQMEVLKSLNEYIEQHKTEFQFISWRSKESRVIEVDCNKSKEICAHINRSKDKVVFFTGRHPDQYELYHGDISHGSILKFTQEVFAGHIYQIRPDNFESLKSDGAEWFYDFSAPWCPPCRNFLPHVRYASQSMHSKNVKFGYVDCEAYKSLCQHYNVRSYPTILFYGYDNTQKSIVEEFDGDHHWEAIQDFYEDIKYPSLTKLDSQTFYREVVGREDGVIWFVDFAANWCKPCQMMLPEFKDAAKTLRGRVNFGYLECTEYKSICSGFGISSYPTVQLFPAKTENNIDPRLIKFNYGRRDSFAFLHFLSNNIKAKKNVIDGTQLRNFDSVVRQNLPVVVDFFANWCGPCQEFMPIFQLANVLVENVTFIKVDCAGGQGRTICQQNNIQQYPTIKFMKKASHSNGKLYISEIETGTELDIFIEAIQSELGHHGFHDEL